MQKKQKRLLFLSIIFVVVVLGVLLCVYYIPFNRILHISGTTEAAFVNRQHINSDVPNTLYFDFEVDPKVGNTGRFYKGIAHSGQYSTKTFGKNTYSFSVERTAKEIGIDNLGAVSMSAWVYVFPGKNDPQGSLVFAGSNGDINITWKAISVSGNIIPRGKWFKISGMFDLSDVKFKPDSKLVIYFWNNSSTDILTDDFYIVFGGPKPRHGDSTFVNLVVGKAFTPKFNFPPFPFHYFTKEEIHNNNSSYLIKNGKIKEGDISPYDKLFSGHFISNKEPEDLFVINKSGNASIYTFCKNDQEFRKFSPIIPPEIQSSLLSANIICGNFTGNSAQILISEAKGFIIGEFEKARDACSGKAGQVSFKTVLKSANNPLPKGASLYSADLDGNKISEILAISPDGSWKIFRLEKGGLSLLASKESDPLNQWNAKENYTKVTTGKFLQNYPQDLILTVSKVKSKPGYSWTILRFDLASRSLLPCFNEKQKHLGKTIGIDTIKPTDEFLTGTFDPSGKVRVFRYNRDWRYDLKEIRFNDTTFQVIANMDFSGYEKDYNPKYFEILRLFPMLVNTKQTSLLVIGKNGKKKNANGKDGSEFIDLPALPAAISVFSFKNPEK